jgi:tight adherence protein B
MGRGNFGRVKNLPIFNICGTAMVAFTFALFLTGALSIAFFFSTLAATIPSLVIRRKRELEIAKLELLWPELLDHLVSGIQAGLSVAQTLSGLATRGPARTKTFFAECEKKMRSGAEVREILRYMKAHFENATCDQVCEVLDFSLSVGSREIATTLRTLSAYVRTNLALREEIKAKQEWIRNSAILAAIAPWLLLLLLSTQASTVKAYSEPSGIFVLAIGAASTVAAYFWMKRVGAITFTPRVYL